jgi:hypothetical protein
LIDVTEAQSLSDLEKENAKMNRVVKSICRGCWPPDDIRLSDLEPRFARPSQCVAAWSSTRWRQRSAKSGFKLLMPSYQTSNQKRTEETMRKIVLALLGAALIAGATTGTAYSKQRHHVRDARQFTSQHFRNSNAGEIPALPQTWSGAAGAWGSYTGYN